MSQLVITGISEAVLVEILHFLAWYELVQLQFTSKLFHRLISDRINSSLWHLAYRTLTFARCTYCRSINWHEKLADTCILTSGNPLTVTSLPIDVRRSGHSLSILRDEVAVVFGGMCMSNALNPNFYVRDLGGPPTRDRVSPSVSGSLPSKRWLHSSNTIDYKQREVVLIFGGFSAEPEMYCNDLHMVSVDAVHSVSCERVKAIGRAPAPRCGHSSVNISEHKLLVFAGFGDEYFNDLHILEVTSSEELRWTTLNPVGLAPSPRYCHSAVYAREKLYIVAGWDEFKFYNDVHVYDLALNCWSEMHTSGAVPRPICQCSAAYFPPSYRFTHDSSTTSENQGFLIIFGGAYRSDMVRWSAIKNIIVNIYVYILCNYDNLCSSIHILLPTWTISVSLT